MSCWREWPSPTKHIGSFFTKEQIERIAKESDYSFIKYVVGRYRRVVPSPKQIETVGKNVIRETMTSAGIFICWYTKRRIKNGFF